MKLLAFDTETELIADRAALPVHSGGGRTGRVLTQPFTPPRLVLGTYCDEAEPSGVLLAPDRLIEVLRFRLEHGWHVIGHNLSFDMQVTCEACPELWPLFLEAAAEGRLHDTMILDQLYGLAIGRYDKPKYDPQTGSWAAEKLAPRSLDLLAAHYCGMRLTKDNSVRLGFGAYAGRLHELPSDFRQYAIQDAVATYRVFHELWRRLQQLQARNWLSEALQVRAQIVCADMDRRGLHIDRDLAQRLRKAFEQDLAPLQHALVAAQLGHWQPVPKTQRPEPCLPDHNFEAGNHWQFFGGRLWRRRVFTKTVKTESAEAAFVLSDRSLQDALSKVPVADSPPLTPKTGQLSLDADWWAQRLPAEAATLRLWLQYEKLQKVLSTYLNVYSSGDRIFPRWWVLGARSGRMSASCPSVQNVPKRKYGIRALFVPSPGMLFTKADYSAQEMFTLCEVMLNMGIKGPLYDALTGPEDIHRYGAGLVLCKAPALVTKEERQAQKALHFGVPGGLGPVKLANYAFDNYGVKWTVDEAKAARLRFLEAFPDVDEYLKANKRGQDSLLRKLTGQGASAWHDALELEQNVWNVIKAMSTHTNPEIRAIGIEAERNLTIELPTGLRRANCTFTEGSNCGFQGLAAAVTKHAAWLAYREGLEISLIVHDEIVIQHRPDSVPEWPATILQNCMLQAFEEICPQMGPFAKVEVIPNIDRWGPATDSAGNTLDIATAAA
jgi:DNA polymerase family A/3'-5' exonuclease